MQALISRKKIITIVSVLLTSFFVSCGGGNGNNNDNTACTLDVKICSDGSYVGRVPPDCRFAPCPDEINFDVSCNTDGDCVLLNKRYGFGCCWSGACDPIDYSLSNWISVNHNWLDAQRSVYCPSPEQCGPAPGCPTRIINDRFIPLCLDQRCIKSPL